MGYEETKLSPDLMRAPRREIRGLRVRLTQTIRTKGGDVFRAGRIMKIEDRWRGEFDLSTLQKGGGWIRRVPPGRFVVEEAENHA